MGVFIVAAPQEPKTGTARVAWSATGDTGEEYFVYAPQEDVTLYELAALMPVFSMADSFGKWRYFSEAIKKNPKLFRHFKKTL